LFTLDIIYSKSLGISDNVLHIAENCVCVYRVYFCQHNV